MYDRPGLNVAAILDDRFKVLRGLEEERARLSVLIRQNEKLRKIAQSVEPGYAASFNASPGGRGLQRDRGKGRGPE